MRLEEVNIAVDTLYRTNVSSCQRDHGQAEDRWSQSETAPRSGSGKQDRSQAWVCLPICRYPAHGLCSEDPVSGVAVHRPYNRSPTGYEDVTVSSEFCAGEFELDVCLIDKTVCKAYQHRFNI